MKLRKNSLKSTISFKALPNFPERISQIKYATYDSYEVYYRPQKIREIGGALGKNDTFHSVPVLLPIPSKFGHSPYETYVLE